MPMPSARIKVRVIPRAGKNQVAGLRGDAITIRLQAPPVEGAANEALARFLAKTLRVRPSDIRIVAGERSRDKLIEIEGVGQDEVEQVLKGS